MSSPYKSKIMRLEVNGVIVDTVELVTLETSHMGGVESKYGQDYDYQFKPRNRHAIGMKRCRFTIRKWYKADGSNTDLFYTLFDNDTEFTLKEYLTGITGFRGLTIEKCISYKYNSITEATNDIIGEETVGEGLVYEANTIMSCDDVKDCLEGDYTTWTLKWKKDLTDDLGSDIDAQIQHFEVYESNNRLLMTDASGVCTVISLDGTSLLSEHDIMQPYYNVNIHFSLMKKFYACIEYSSSILLQIYKLGVLIQTIDFPSLFGWRGNTYVAMSSNGKYILISNYNADEIALFEGS